MTIQLSPEDEQVILQAIEAGLIHDANEALDAALEDLRTILQSRVAPPSNPDERVRAFEALLAEFGSNTEIPEAAFDRENWYPDRR